MTINEFMIFVALVCNFDAPHVKVSTTYKENCVDYYVNCSIKDDIRVDRLTLSNCNMKAKKALEKDYDN